MANPRGGLRFRELRPEPRRLWIRFRPRVWPGAPGVWIDLAALALGRPGGGEPGPPAEAEVERLDDVVYLPPAADGAEGWRRRLAERLLAGGTPCLWQSVTPGPAPAGAAVVWDPTETLLDGGVEILAQAPRGASVLWPWVAGLTDAEDLWRPALDRLRGAGAERVLPLRLELPPRDRRRLAARARSADWSALFHRAARPLEGFARAAASRGLDILWPRPLPAAPARLVVTRGAAGHLAQIADLELALGGSEVVAQSFFRAARRLEEEPHDLKALLREGNLAILTWLEDDPRQAVEEFLRRGGSVALESRRARFGGDGGATG
ncbi:MAG: hypothetical protein R3325_07220 [Thermoanaerobaculia bacterium]|nr:hypothetical protein [Thermoanaerobaculia bacterium]